MSKRRLSSASPLEHTWHKREMERAVSVDKEASGGRRGARAGRLGSARTWGDPGPAHVRDGMRPGDGVAGAGPPSNAASLQ